MGFKGFGEFFVGHDILFGFVVQGMEPQPSVLVSLQDKARAGRNHGICVIVLPTVSGTVGCTQASIVVTHCHLHVRSMLYLRHFEVERQTDEVPLVTGNIISVHIVPLYLHVAAVTQ